MSPLIIIIWTCVIVFVVTALITLLHVSGLWALPNAKHGNTLFKVLIIEVVVIGVAAFGMNLNQESNPSADEASLDDSTASSHQVSAGMDDHSSVGELDNTTLGNKTKIGDPCDVNWKDRPLSCEI